jgi:hypothetical protein
MSLASQVLMCVRYQDITMETTGCSRRYNDSAGGTSLHGTNIKCSDKTNTIQWLFYLFSGT